jgi:penicillin-binding protein 1A
VLGAQPVRPVDLAAFYASIANEGLRPTPHVVESIERNGAVVYRHDPKSSVTIRSVDRAAFYQLKTMLQGVLARGTARAIAGLSPYVAGKTGTSDEENDAWFVGFTNDVTVAVWIGYDNADGKRPHAGRRLDWWPCRSSDFRAGNSGRVGLRCAESCARPAIA